MAEEALLPTIYKLTFAQIDKVSIDTFSPISNEVPTQSLSWHLVAY